MSSSLVGAASTNALLTQIFGRLSASGPAGADAGVFGSQLGALGPTAPSQPISSFPTPPSGAVGSFAAPAGPGGSEIVTQPPPASFVVRPLGFDITVFAEDDPFAQTAVFGAEDEDAQSTVSGSTEDQAQTGTQTGQERTDDTAPGSSSALGTAESDATESDADTSGTGVSGTDESGTAAADGAGDSGPNLGASPIGTAFQQYLNGEVDVPPPGFSPVGSTPPAATVAGSGDASTDDGSEQSGSVSDGDDDDASNVQTITFAEALLPGLTEGFQITVGDVIRGIQAYQETASLLTPQPNPLAV